MGEEIIEKRIYIGGLYDGVTEEDIRSRFKLYGHIKSIDVRRFQLYNNTKWKGETLKLQFAKENFVERLNREREEKPVVEEKKVITSVPEQHEQEKCAAGQIMGENKDWIVGKYGRILPIVNVRNATKVVVVDPSKHCHQVKKLYDISKKVIPCDELTWDLPTDNRAITGKVTGKTILKDPKPVEKVRTRDEVIAEMRGTTVEEMYKLEVVRVNEWIEKRKGHNFTVVDDDLDIVTSGGQGGGGDEDYNSADTEEMITQMKRPKTTDVNNEIQTIEINDPESESKVENTKKKVIKKKVKKTPTKSEEKAIHNNDSDTSDDETDKKSSSAFGGTKAYLKKNPIATPNPVDNKPGALKKKTPKSASSVKSVTKVTTTKSSSASSKGANREYNSSDEEGDTSNWRTCQSKITNDHEEFLNNNVDSYAQEFGSDNEDVVKTLSFGDKSTKVTAKKETKKSETKITKKRIVEPVKKSVAQNKSSDLDTPLKKKDELTKSTPEKPVKKSVAENKSSDVDTPLKKKVKPTKSNPEKPVSPAVKAPLKKLVKPKKSSGAVEKRVEAKPLTSTITSEGRIQFKSSGVAKRVYHSSDDDEDELGAGAVKTSDWRSCQSRITAAEFVNTDVEHYGEDTHAAAVGMDTTLPDQDDIFDLIASGDMDTMLAPREKRQKLLASSGEGFQVVVEAPATKTEKGAVDSKAKRSKKDILKNVDLKDKSSKKVKKEKKKLKTEAKLAEREARLHKPSKTGLLTADIVEGEEEAAEEEPSYELKFNKRKQSNLARLTSLSDRKKDSRGHQDAISRALNNIDKSCSAKKIIFDDSDESEEVEIIEKNESLKLFAEDQGSSDDEENDQKMFEHKSQFEGKAGAELMHLQSRYKNDSRFKLDNRFVDKENTESQSDGSNDSEEETEKSTNLNILKDVIGEKEMIRMNKKEQRKGKFRDMQTMQYDPTSEDHKKFELESEDDEEDNKRIPRKLTKTMPMDDNAGKQKAKETQAERIPGQFINVDSSLKTILKTNEGFSFDFSADNIEVIKPKTTKEKPAMKTEEKSMSNDLLSWKTKFSDESSDDEEAEKDTEKDTAKDEISIECVKSDNSEIVFKDTYFFSENDARFEAGSHWLCRSLPKGVIRSCWKIKREELIEDYHLRRKRALRKTKSMKNSKRKIFR